MKLENWARLSAAATTLILMTACGADHHGSATVPRRATFTGLWMSDQAFRDVQKDVADLDRFCVITYRNRARHGLTKQRLNNPKVQIFEIVNGGTVYRWAPNLFTEGRNQLEMLTIGRLDGAGTSSIEGYGGVRLGTLRFTDFDHLVQTNGDDLFPETQLRARTAYPSSPEYDRYTRGGEGQVGFTRVDRGFAELYVSQLRKCDPVHFPANDGGAVAAPRPNALVESDGREPGRRPNDPANAPLTHNTWDPPAAAPARPVTPAPVARPAPRAPDRGHVQESIGAAPGHIEDEDQDSN